MMPLILILSIFVLSFPAAADPIKTNKDELEEEGFHWNKALVEAGFFLGLQHGFRIATEPSSRANLKGPFFADYFQSASAVRGWSDGDPYIVNYVGHPMMGAVTGYIYVQNDPRGKGQVFGRNPNYWKSRLRALAFSAAYSVQFELGPVSESSIGNVGLDGKGQGAVDLVVTPVLGFAWQTTEDAMDRLVVEPLERRFKNRVVRLALRSGLNPSRSFSNALRFKVPWYRDSREHGIGYR
jgi:hypothetical protein